MTTYDYKTPTDEEMQAIMARAHQMRAEAMRAGAIAAVTWVRGLAHRVSHLFATHKHA